MQNSSAPVIYCKSFSLLDEDESIWSATDGKDRTAFLKTETSASIDSRASLDTVDSGVPTRNLDDSTEQFYNA